MGNRVTIEQNNNQVVTDRDVKYVTVVNPDCEQIRVLENVTNVVTIIAPGPQGPQGPEGNASELGAYLLTSSFNAFTSSYNTGSFSGSFTGQFLGTSSWSSNTVSSSYALTASYALNVPNTASYSLQSLSSSYSITASYALNVPQTASYAIQALSSSYSTTSSYALTASYALNIPSTASYALQALSSSYSVTSSYSLTASYALNVPSTASYALQALSSSYALQSLSSSFASTASYAPLYLPLAGGTIDGNIVINGTASISYLNVTFESASVVYSSGSNQFGDAANDTQTLYGTVNIPTGSLIVTGSITSTVGFTGSLLGTSSHSETSLYSISSSYANTSSWSNNALTASYVQASSVVGLNLSRISTGSITASVNIGSNVFSLVSSSNTNLLVTNTGYIGVNNAAPSYSLDVIGTSRVSGSVIISGSGVTSATRPLITVNSVGSSSFYVTDEGAIYIKTGSIIYGDSVRSTNDSHLIIRQAWSAGGMTGISIGARNTDISNTSTSTTPIIVGGSNVFVTSSHIIFGNGNTAQPASLGTLFAFGTSHNMSGSAGSGQIMIGSSHVSTQYTNGQSYGIFIGLGNNNNTFYGGGLIGSGLKYYANRQLAFGSNSDNVNFAISEVYFGNGVRNENTSANSNSGHGPNVSINVSQAATASVTSRNGGNLSLRGGQGTGTGSAGDVIFVTATTGSTDNSTFHTYSNRVIIKGNTGWMGVGTNSPSYSLDVSGSTRITNGLIVTGSVIATNFTGSIFGSSSYALTASYALNVGGASINTSSFATTGSNTFIGTQIISGSVILPQLTSQVNKYVVSYDTASGQLYYQITSSGGGSGTPGGSSGQIQYNSAGAFDGVPTLTYVGGNLYGTGSFTGSFTGTLIGTASWSNNSVTSSYAIGYVLNSQTSSMTVLSASFASTASLSFKTSGSMTGSLLGTSSFSNFAISASYIDGGFY